LAKLCYALISTLPGGPTSPYLDPGNVVNLKSFKVAAHPASQMFFPIGPSYREPASSLPGRIFISPKKLSVSPPLLPRPMSDPFNPGCRTTPATTLTILEGLDIFFCSPAAPMYSFRPAIRACITWFYEVVTILDEALALCTHVDVIIHTNNSDHGHVRWTGIPVDEMDVPRRRADVCPVRWCSPSGSLEASSTPPLQSLSRLHGVGVSCVNRQRRASRRRGLERPSIPMSWSNANGTFRITKLSTGDGKKPEAWDHEPFSPRSLYLSRTEYTSTTLPIGLRSSRSSTRACNQPGPH